MDRRDLTRGWQLSLGVANPQHPPPALPAEIPAAVPGCVHTDLLAAGLIPDPYLDTNEVLLDWIGHQTWRYRTTFEWSSSPADPTEQVDLVCEGLDTVATVLLNQVQIGRFRNQHRSYRIPVQHLLQDGTNELAVVFESAWAYAENVRAELGDLPNAYPTPFNFIRKMACNFGWDWGPTLVTAGIWKPIALESWSLARFSRVRPIVTVHGDKGQVQLEVDLETAADRALTVTATVAGVRQQITVPAGTSSARLDLEVPDVELWWPHHLGSQARYELDVALADGDLPLDSWRRAIGFRSVRLDTGADDIGSAFTIVVNEVPIFVRGANWIPDDCFPTRITRDRLRDRISQAIEANIDLLRVWGGGLYESDDFYELCDELGVLVWQDFLFACAAYPEEEPIRSEVLAEAAENVARLMPHPSLVLWNGCNENIWGWFDWSWQEPVGDRTWGAGYYFDLLPAIVAEIDPSRPYYPGSPFSGSMAIHPNDDNHGLRHIWDVWNDVDYSVYRQYVPRFVAEFGYQAPANISTIHRSINDIPLTPTSPGMRQHQKAIDGNEKLIRGAAPHLPVGQGFDQWHYLMQLNQAEAIRFGIKHFRSHRGRCMGSIVWQLNDCWPVTSWAAIDGDGRRKLLWYALREANSPLLLTIQPRAGGLALVGVNDSGSDWRDLVTVQRLRFDGTVLATWETALIVRRLAALTVELPGELVVTDDPTAEFLVATTAGLKRALWFFAEDKDLALRTFDLSPEIEPFDGGLEVTVHAPSLARHVAIQADRWHPGAVADDGLVTILPGNSHTFRIRAPRDADATTFLSSTALCWLNELVAGTTE